MPIKLEVDTDTFAETVRNNVEPIGYGDLVFAWDADTTVLVAGVHCGYDDYYDCDTGVRVRHRHKVLVLSWTDQSVMTFDKAMSIPQCSRLRRVITEFGAGYMKYISVSDKKVKVLLDSDVYVVELDIDEVKLFDWERIKGAYTKNDKPTA